MRRDWRTVLTEGFFAGLIGYAVVAVVMGIFDVLGGQPLFRTPALLGSAMFYGLSDPARLRIWPGPVLAFNGVHLLVFQVLGVIAAWFAHLSERGPQFWYVGAVVFIFVLFHLFGVMLFASPQMSAVVGVWKLLLAGVAAVAGMSAYLIRVHPLLRDDLAHEVVSSKPGVVCAEGHR